MTLGLKRALREMEAATGKILETGPNGTQPVGTAFCISPDGIVLTAGHILNDDSNYSYALKFKDQNTPLKLRIEQRCNERNTGADYAILRADGNAVLPFLAVADVHHCSGETLQRGYPDVFKEQTDATGTFLGNIDVDDDKNKRLFHFTSQQAGASGFSGSPIYSTLRGGVVGIQTEAVLRASGPLSTSVLAFPIFRIAGFLGASRRTRLAWWLRSRSRALAANLRIVSAFALVLTALTWISVVGVSYVLALQKQQDALSDPRFHQLSAAESTFWMSPEGRAFASAHSGPGSKWHADIYQALETSNPPMLPLILEQAEIYEKASTCVLGSLCFRDSVCADLYPKIWSFYNAYQGVWTTYTERIGNRPDTNMQYFLRKYCPRQNDLFCRRTNARICD